MLVLNSDRVARRLYQDSYIIHMVLNIHSTY